VIRLLFTRAIAEHDLVCTYLRPPPEIRQHSGPRWRSRDVPHAMEPGRNSDHISFTRDPRSIPGPEQSFQQAVVAPEALNGVRASRSSQAITPDTPQDTSGSTHVAGTTDQLVSVQHSSAESVEFYGATSPVAVLDRQRQQSAAADAGVVIHRTKSRTGPGQMSPGDAEHLSIRLASRFLDAYFSNIHCIEPIFEKEDFLGRCEDVWHSPATRQPPQFLALYHATLGLGSLLAPNESAQEDGDQSWSYKLYKKALDILSSLDTPTNLRVVQCWYMMVGCIPLLW
jgi:hypothetical protein